MQAHHLLQLTPSRKVWSQFLGTYRSSCKGSWISFAESRVYTSGDPYQRIDRKTTAKKQELYIKEFEEERLIRVLVVIPRSPQLLFHTTHPTKIVYVSKLLTLLTHATLSMGDRIGFLVDTWTHTHYLPPASHRRSLVHIQATLEQMNDTASSYSEPSINHTIHFLDHQHLRHHLIIWIGSSLVTPDDHLLQAVEKTNDLLRLQLFDPFEMTGKIRDEHHPHYQLSDKKHLYPIHLDEASVLHYQEKFKEAYAEHSRLLTSRGVSHSACSTVDDPLVSLMHLFQTHHRIQSR